MTTTGDIIVAAAKEFETRGWCKGALQDHVGKVCALGAINLAVLGDAYGWLDTDTPVFKALADHVPAEFKQKMVDEYHYSSLSDIEESSLMTMVEYNNDSDTTLEVMREWFAKAAMDAGITVS